MPIGSSNFMQTTPNSNTFCVREVPNEMSDSVEVEIEEIQLS